MKFEFECESEIGHMSFFHSHAHTRTLQCVCDYLSVFSGILLYILCFFHHFWPNVLIIEKSILESTSA